MERNSEDNYNYNKVHLGIPWTFLDLLKLRTEDDINILRALHIKNSHTYISLNIQNKILEIISHTIIKSICKQINEESKQFGITVDGTQYICGIEHEAICVRYITSIFDVKEDFIGLYENNKKYRRKYF